MTVEELSERIINGDFLEHSDESDSAEFQHYGVLGMKWGVRKDRQRKGETDQQYKDRLDRESRERIAAADRKAKEKEQKRTLKSQERIQKAQIKSNERKEAAQRKSQEKNQAAQRKMQEKQQEAQRKAQEKQQKKNDPRTRDDRNKNKKSAGLMTDAELDKAINRMRKENEYAALSKRPDSGAMKLAKGAANTALKIGKSVLVTQLTIYGGRKLGKALGNPDPQAKKTGDNQSQSQAKKAAQTASDVAKTVNAAASTISKNSAKLNSDAFSNVWDTKIYRND